MRSPARVLPAPLLVLLTVGCATVVQAPAPATPATPSTPSAIPYTTTAHDAVDVYVTFYGGPDNDPPGTSEIAYPNSRHGSAGGVGSHADPISLATDPRELAPGTVVYAPQWQKYFVMEDDCAACIDEWRAERRPHVDLWMGPTGRALPECEETLTPDDPVPLEINPPADRPVDPRPLYDTTTDRCLTP